MCKQSFSSQATELVQRWPTTLRPCGYSASNEEEHVSPHYRQAHACRENTGDEVVPSWMLLLFVVCGDECRTGTPDDPSMTLSKKSISPSAHGPTTRMPDSISDGRGAAANDKRCALAPEVRPSGKDWIEEGAIHRFRNGSPTTPG